MNAWDPEGHEGAPRVGYNHLPSKKVLPQKLDLSGLSRCNWAIGSSRPFDASGRIIGNPQDSNSTRGFSNV